MKNIRNGIVGAVSALCFVTACSKPAVQTPASIEWDVKSNLNVSSDYATPDSQVQLVFNGK